MLAAMFREWICSSYATAAQKMTGLKTNDQVTRQPQLSSVTLMFMQSVMTHKCKKQPPLLLPLLSILLILSLTKSGDIHLSIARKTERLKHQNADSLSPAQTRLSYCQVALR